MQKLTALNLIRLDKLPGFPAKNEFLLGQYLKEIGLRPSVYLAESLPLEENRFGDFRFVVSEKAFYTWTGEAWEPLFGFMDQRFSEQGQFLDGVNPSLRNQTTASVETPLIVHAAGPMTWEPAQCDGNLSQAIASAVYAGTPGALFTSGSFLDSAPFTADGGKPDVNGLCFLAAAADDRGTGAGKFSARPPDKEGQWVVRCGTVIDNSTYDQSKTCKVLFYPDYPVGL